VPVVVGEFQQQIAHVFEKKADEMNSRLRFADREWEMRSQKIDEEELQLRVRHYDGSEMEFVSQLSGPHQSKNLITVLESVRTLSDSGWNLTAEHFKAGVRSTISNTGLKGRWQVLAREPLIIADTGHNKEGIEPNLKRLLSVRNAEQLHFVWGMVSDKDVIATLKMLPPTSNYYFCKPDVPRGLDVNILAHTATEIGLSYSVHASVADALKKAKDQAMPDDIIYVGGSTFVVAEVV
jgi:dihydrofolate synthase/folylpolyglutamate synthase